MDPYDLSIRLKTLDGQWEEVGAEAVRYRGVWPENLRAEADDWGSTICSFDLRRDPGAIHPDLSAFTDCEITVAGRLVWSGRVKETPTREGADPVINVQGEGWQYHLDDDQYERAYVHARLSDWTDMRSSLTTPLGQAAYCAAGQISTDGGITLMFRNGDALLSGASVGIYLDLGPGSVPQAVAFDYDTSNNNNTAAGPYFEASCTNDLSSDGTLIQQSALTTLGATANNAVLIPTGGARYIILKLQAQANVTVVNDCWIRFRGIRTFTDAAYRSGGASVLRADQIISDALDKATLLLDPDRSGIQQGVFDEIPEFATSQLVSPREAWKAANAYENYESKIDDRRPTFRPRAATPIYEIGEWSGAEFEDASANSGAEILNNVFVEGQDAAGSRLVVERAAGDDVTAPFQVIPSPAMPNPSFSTNTAGWTAAGDGTITRFPDPGSQSPPGFGQFTWVFLGTDPMLTTSFSGTFEAGITYVLQFYAALTNQVYYVPIRWGVLGVDEAPPIILSTLFHGSGYVLHQLTWSPSADRTGVQFRMTTPAVGSPYGINNDDIGESVTLDTFVLGRSLATLVDRRGFRKSRTLPIGNRITPASGARIGDLYLEQHRTTPFTGGFKATGVGGVRRILGGQAVHPAWLLRDTGQMVRANHVIDPDTGAVGRDERIKTVSYDHNTLTATVSLAEDRSGLDALLAQLAVVVGG